MDKETYNNSYKASIAYNIMNNLKAIGRQFVTLSEQNEVIEAHEHDIFIRIKQIMEGRSRSKTEPFCKLPETMMEIKNKIDKNLKQAEHDINKGKGLYSDYPDKKPHAPTVIKVAKSLIEIDVEKYLEPHGQLASNYKYRWKKGNSKIWTISLGFLTPHNQNLLRRVINEIVGMIILHYKKLSQCEMKEELMRLALLPKNRHPDVDMKPETVPLVKFLDEEEKVKKEVKVKDETTVKTEVKVKDETKAKKKKATKKVEPKTKKQKT